MVGVVFQSCCLAPVLIFADVVGFIDFAYFAATCFGAQAQGAFVLGDCPFAVLKHVIGLGHVALLEFAFFAIGPLVGILLVIRCLLPTGCLADVVDIVVLALCVLVLDYYAEPCRRTPAQFIGVVPENGQVVFVVGNGENVPTFHVGAYGAAIKTFRPVRHVGFCLFVVPCSVACNVPLEVVDGAHDFGFVPIANEQEGDCHQGSIRFVVFTGACDKSLQVFRVFNGGCKTEGGHNFVLGLFLGGKDAVALVYQLYDTVVFQVREQVDVHFGTAGQVGQSPQSHGILAPFSRHLVAPQSTDFKHCVGVNQVHLGYYEIALVAGNFVNVFAACVGQGVVMQKDFAKHEGRIELEWSLLRCSHNGCALDNVAVSCFGDPYF